MSSVPLLIDFGIGALSKGVDSMFAGYRNNKQYQYALSQQNNNFLLNERAADNAMIRQRELMWLESQYNSYGTKMQQAQEAGLNPFALFGQGQQVGVSGAAAPDGGAGAPGSSPPVFPPSFSDSFGNLSVALKNLAEAKNLGLDTEFLEQTLSSRVEQQLISEDTARYTRDILLPLEGKIKDKELSLISEKISETIENTALLLAKKELTIEQKNETIKKIENIIADTYLKKSQKTELDIRIGKLSRLLESEIAANNAAARHDIESAETLSALRPHEVKFLENAAGMKEIDHKQAAENYESISKTLRNAGALSDLQLRQLEALAALAEKENDSYYWRLVFDELNKAAQTASEFLPKKMVSSSTSSVDGSVANYDGSGRMVGSTRHHTKTSRTSKTKTKRALGRR